MVGLKTSNELRMRFRPLATFLIALLVVDAIPLESSDSQPVDLELVTDHPVETEASKYFRKFSCFPSRNPSWLIDLVDEPGSVTPELLD